jgi:pimeloyl-ACP methyl ester carboxylesterase
MEILGSHKQRGRGASQIVALMIASSALCAPRAIALSRITYAYTGNALSCVYACTSSPGHVTGSVTFDDIPLAYTGTVGTVGSASSVSLTGPTNFSQSSAGVSVTISYPTADPCVGADGTFQFAKGSVVQWSLGATYGCTPLEGEGLTTNSILDSAYYLLPSPNGQTPGAVFPAFSYSPGTWALVSYQTGTTPPLQITTTSLPNATSGQPYPPVTFSATGGSGTSQTWCVQSGSSCVQSGSPLPDGFTLSSAGVLSSTGSPSAAAGSYSFTVAVADSAGNFATQLLTLVVQRQPGMVTLLDPVPNLLSGSSVNGSSAAIAATLLSVGTPQVQGVAADGVSELVVQVNGALPNENLVMALYGDGGLANLGSNSFQQVAITLQADSQGNAFALYQAPVDFVSSAADSGLAFRNDVRLHLYSNDDPTFMADTQVVVVRPLVMLVHGQWANSLNTWGHFTPLTTSSLFTIVDGDYSDLVTVSFSSPSYLPSVLDLASGSALGLGYGTPLVLQQLNLQLEIYRQGVNRAGVLIAAVQADVVAHSMGGLVARNVALQPGYSSPTTYGAGLIHKLITIDTPHLGTPIAGDLLNDANSCVRNVMAALGNITFRSVVTNGMLYDGSVGDLRVPGPNAPNPAIQNLAPVSIPMATIAGVTNSGNLSMLGTLGGAVIEGVCGVVFGNPLGKSLTPSNWNSNFPNETGNDGVIGQKSQFNGQTMLPPDLLFTGYIHNGYGLTGLELLGFTGPTVLDPGAVPNEVINLLNTPITDSTHFKQ